MSLVKLVVFDMAGTTVQDEQEVEKCFTQAAVKSNLPFVTEDIISMMGWSKRLVFETLWEKALPGTDEATLESHISESYNLFTEILENHYRTNKVVPTTGCLELFDWLKANGIKIALTTGFYRIVTDIILEQIGWNKGLNDEYLNGDIIDFSVTSDEVTEGRPKPYMIERCMEKLGISDPKQVVKIGDTPSDLLAGKNADCLMSFGVTNGTHTKEQLSAYENNGLFKDLYAFKQALETIVT